jgi:DNA-binding CsgD family transcriptional regulator
VSAELSKTVLEICDRMRSTTSSREVRDLATETLHVLGWKSWVYVGHVAVRMAHTSSVLFASNYPLAWLAEYRFRGYYGIDPIVGHVMTNDLPIIWEADEDQWRESGPDAYRFIARLKKRGYAGGVGTPVHTLVSRGFLNVTTTDPLSTREREIELIRAYGLLIGNSIHDALYRISFPERVRLSEMQMKVLQWVAEGANAEIIADKLGIKVPTVLYHITQAQKKLKVKNIGAKNRQELITKAYAMGYLNSVMNWGEDTVLNVPDLEEKLSAVWKQEVKPNLNDKN